MVRIETSNEQSDQFHYHKLSVSVIQVNSTHISFVAYYSPRSRQSLRGHTERISFYSIHLYSRHSLRIRLNMISDIMDDIVGNMHDLDNDLFGNNFQKKNVSAKQDKKKVIFDDSNENDSLTDLLRDDEDFLNQPISDTNKKDSALSVLFGLKNTESTKASNQGSEEKTKSATLSETGSRLPSKLATKSDDWIHSKPDSSFKLEDEVRRPKTAPRIHDAINYDELIPSSNEKTKNLENKDKKSLLMEDLFGNRPRPRTSPDKLLQQERPKSPKPVLSIDQKKSEQSSTLNATLYAPSVSTTRGTRRGRRSSGGNLDLLGIFSTSDEARKEPEKNPEPSAELPEWLDGRKKSTENISVAKKNIDLAKSQPEKEPSSSTVANIQRVSEERNAHDNSAPVPETIMENNNHDDTPALSAAQFDQQAMMMSLQQQEHEWKTATTLYRQTEQFSRMVENQRQRLSDQEKQFNLLVKKQIDRQELLESQMKMQHDRINSHLQLLLTQPTFVPSAAKITDVDESIKLANEYRSKQMEMESEIQKILGEKIYFENSFIRLKENHEKELKIIEESYTRQIDMMTEGMERLEKRLRQDFELAEGDYEAKLQKLRDDQTALKVTHAEEIEILKKEHKKHLEEIQNQQKDHMELVQKEYAETIENVNKANDMERQCTSGLMRETKNLTEISTGMKIMTDEIEQLKSILKNETGAGNRIIESNLKQQVEELKDLKAYLIKHQKTDDSEHDDLLAAARRLEAGASRLTMEFETFTKAKLDVEEKLKSREEALVKGRELLDAQIRWEREHIQAEKEMWLREQERQSAQLLKEQNILAAERAKFETLRRLKINVDDTAKTEIEAALAAARDVTNIANQERQKWMEKSHTLEIQRQQLQRSQDMLSQRAKELENLTQSALEKRDEGMKALQEAFRLKEEHKVYVDQLRNQMEVLTQHERKIAAEKIMLARERLGLRISQANNPERDTAVVPFNDMSNQTSRQLMEYDDRSNSPMVITRFKEIVDPHLVLLKLSLDTEMNVTNNCLEKMQSVHSTQ